MGKGNNPMPKVLIICYYWPPAGGPGVQRWLNFVKYLPENGIEPVVFVPQNAHYPMEDKSLEAEIPEGIEVVQHPIVEPYRWAGFFSKKKTKQISSGIIREKNPGWLEKAMLWIRGNLFIPDARVLWVKPAAQFLEGYLKKSGIDTVITTGPPHSLHLIGLRLKEQLGVHWIADFRDPWTTIGYHSKLRLGKRASSKHKELEQKVLQTADQVVVTSTTTKKEFTALTAKPISVITNGYDGDVAKEGQLLDTAFSLSHIGSLLSARNPTVLWEVLSELVREMPAFKEQLRLQFIGVVSDDIKQSLRDYHLDSHAEFLGYLPHSTVLEYQRQSQMLLLLEIDSPKTTGILPGKLFEYMAAKRPILGIGPAEWEVADRVQWSKSGAVFTHQDREGIKRYIQQSFAAYQKGNLFLNDPNIESYHRRELTKLLAKLMPWE